MKSSRFSLILMTFGLCGSLATGQQAPSTEIHFAYFASGMLSGDGLTFQGLRTALTAINPGPDEAEVRVQMFDTAGSPKETKLRARSGNLLDNPFLLHRRTSIEFALEIEPGIINGHLRILSSAPVAVLANLQSVWGVFIGPLPFPLIQVLSNTELQPAQPVSSFSVNVEETETSLTGLSIIIVGSDGPVGGRLRLIDASGAERSSEEVVLQPGRQLVRQAVEIFPDLAELFLGTIEGDFDEPVRIVALKAGRFDNSLQQKLVARRSIE